MDGTTITAHADGGGSALATRAARPRGRPDAGRLGTGVQAASHLRYVDAGPAVGSRVRGRRATPRRRRSRTPRSRRSRRGGRGAASSQGRPGAPTSSAPPPPTRSRCSSARGSGDVHARAQCGLDATPRDRASTASRRRRRAEGSAREVPAAATAGGRPLEGAPERELDAVGSWGDLPTRGAADVDSAAQRSTSRSAWPGRTPPRQASCSARRGSWSARIDLTEARRGARARRSRGSSSRVTSRYPRRRASPLRTGPVRPGRRRS